MNIPDKNDIVIELSESPFGEAFKPEMVETSEVIQIAQAQENAPTFFQKLKTFVRPVSKLVSESSKAAITLLQDQKEKEEVQIGEYVKIIESKIDLKDAKEKIKEIEATSTTQKYENRVRRSFEEGVCNVTIDAEKEELTNSVTTFNFGVEIFNFMGAKLQESSLAKNIEYMTVTTTLEKNEIMHLVEFELKVSGQRWSSIFSKFISKEIFERIEWANGKIDGHYMNNVTLIRETFVLIFSHTRLEMIEASEAQKAEAEILESSFKESHQELNQDI